MPRHLLLPALCSECCCLSGTVCGQRPIIQCETHRPRPQFNGVLSPCSISGREVQGLFFVPWSCQRGKSRGNQFQGPVTRPPARLPATTKEIHYLTGLVGARCVYSWSSSTGQDTKERIESLQKELQMVFTFLLKFSLDVTAGRQNHKVHNVL